MREILHTRISSPNRPEFLHYPQGIALVIVNAKGEILLGKENHIDTYRPRKKWNIITETLNISSDQGIKAPITRAIQEELGAPVEWFSYIPGTYRETNGSYVQKMKYPYKYRCVCLLYAGPEDMKFHSHDVSEISEHRWFPVKHLPFNLEVGARLVINAYRRLLKL